MNIINNSKIISELKLNLLIYNKIIIKNEIINDIKELYNKSNENDSLILLLRLLSYIWLVKDENLIKILKEEFIRKSDLNNGIINGLSINSISLKCIIIINKIGIVNMQNYQKISNILQIY